MKKLTLIIFLLIFLQISASSQPCLPEGITFTTQSQIDNFQVNYPNCTEIEGDVEIYGNDITNLNGLSVLTSTVGIIYIGTWAGGNPALTSLTGLDNVTSIGGGLFVFNNDALISLSGLEGLPSIGGFLSIRNNDALISLTGLDNLTSIGGDLYIAEHDALTNLTGLTNVTSIDSEIRILYHPALTSLAGLDNIDASSISLLEIIGNVSLSTCEVQSICDYLSSPSGTINIAMNASGCNSQQEVEDACDTLSVEDIIYEGGFSIFPNPATDRLTISPKDGVTIDEVILYNQIGQKVLHHKPVMQPIDVSMLRQGMYVIDVICGKRKMRGKFIK